MIANRLRKMKLLFDARTLEEITRKPVTWMREQTKTLPNTSKPFINEKLTM
jgi:hypothetical protein